MARPTIYEAAGLLIRKRSSVLNTCRMEAPFWEARREETVSPLPPLSPHGGAWGREFDGRARRHRCSHRNRGHRSERSAGWANGQPATAIKIGWETSSPSVDCRSCVYCGGSGGAAGPVSWLHARFQRYFYSPLCCCAHPARWVMIKPAARGAAHSSHSASWLDISRPQPMRGSSSCGG